jgi:YVTN family beta-propeller protein
MPRTVPTTSALVLALALAAGGGPAAASGAHPGAPTITGARHVVVGPVVLRLAAREPGVAPARLRFRCSFDGAPLRRCTSNLRATLPPGRHLLRALAVDPAGRPGPLARATIVVDRVPTAPAVSVGGQPVNIAFGAGALWIANNGDGTLSRLDPASQKVTTTIQIGGAPAGVAASDSAVWVGNFSEGKVRRVDPVSGAVVATLATGSQPLGPAVASDGSLWVSDFTGSLTHFDAAGGVLSRLSLPGQPAFLAIGLGAVWVTNTDGDLQLVDPATGALVGAPIPIGQDVDAISLAPDAAWVSTYSDGVVARVDPGSHRVTRRFRLGARLGGIVVDGTSVWVSLYDEALVEQLDGRTGAVLRAVRVGREPREMVIAAGSLWVVDQGSDSVSRIGL